MRFSSVLLLLAGVVIGVLAMFAVRPDAPAPSPRSVATRAPAHPELDALAARLERIERRLAEPPAPAAAPDGALAERLDRIEALLRGRPSSAVAGEPAAGVPLATLRLRALGLSSDLTRAADAVEAWGRVAERATDPEAKAEAWIEQGEVYRELEDYAGAAAVWEKAVNAVGLRSERGRSAAFKLGLAYGYEEDHRAAYRTFRQLAGAPGISKRLGAAARFQAACYARANGDIDAARREYERLVADYARDGEEHYRKLAANAAERLKELP